MNFRKFISGVSALAIAASAFAGMAVTASADFSADGYTYTAEPTYDVSMHQGNQSNGIMNGNSMYVLDPNKSSLDSDRIMALRFAIPETPAGKIIESVELRLITQSLSASRTLGIYSFNPGSKWTAESGITWYEQDTSRNYVGDEITTALEADPITTFTPKGMPNRHVYMDKVEANYEYLDTTAYQNYEAWKNTISIPTSAINESSNFDFLIANSDANALSNNIMFYAKNQNEAIKIVGTETEVPAANLHPLLTITYVDDEKPVSIEGKGNYDTLEAAFTAAESGDTITLNADCTTSSRFFMHNGTTSASDYYNELTSLTIDGDGHTLTLTGNSFTYLFSMVGKSGITLNLKDINIQDNRTSSSHYIVNSRNNITINFTDVTLSNIDRTVIYTYAGSTGTKPTINISGLNVTSAADDKKIVENSSANHVAASTISLASALSGYTVNTIGDNEVLKAKADSYWTFEADSNLSYDTLKVNATINGEVKTATHTLGTAITGGTLGITITGVPYGVTINSITIE